MYLLPDQSRGTPSRKRDTRAKLLSENKGGRLRSLIANLKSGALAVKQQSWADAEERARDNELFAIAMFGILLMIVELHINWDGERIVNNGYTTGLKAMISASTVLLCIRIVALYQFKVVAAQEGNLSDKFSLCHHKFRWKLAIELFLNLLHWHEGLQSFL